MEFTFLVEDISGKVMLKHLIPKILDQAIHHWTIRSFKGVGHIPDRTSMTEALEAAEQTSGVILPQTIKTKKLLDDLRGILNAYGKTYEGQSYAVVVVCDLDYRDKTTFLQKLHEIIESCVKKPNTKFCIAIEEGEAWFFGDQNAIITAYPNAQTNILTSYITDSICGTWEKLADSIFPGGSIALSAKTPEEIGRQKSIWAERISPHMNVDNNNSPSFCHFKNEVVALTQ